MLKLSVLCLGHSDFAEVAMYSISEQNKQTVYKDETSVYFKAD